MRTDALPGGVEEGDEEFRAVLALVAGAAGQDLRGGFAAGRDLREKAVHVESAAGFDEVIGEEDGLNLGDDGTGDAGNQFLVRISGDEIRGDDVLRAGVADEAIDDGELAVVAQIEARGVVAEETDLEHGDDLHARVSKAGSEPRQAGVGAHGVGHHPGMDAAFRRADQRPGHLFGRGVGREDIGEEMNVMPGGVDVAHQSVDRSLVVREKLDGIPLKDIEIAELGGQSRQVGEVVGEGWLADHARQEMGLRIHDALRSPLLLLDALPGHPDTAKERVKGQAGPGQEKDEQQPGPRGGGGALLGHVDEHHEADRPFARQVKIAPGRHEGPRMGDDGPRAKSQEPGAKRRGWSGVGRVSLLAGGRIRGTRPARGDTRPTPEKAPIFSFAGAAALSPIQVLF